MIYIGARSKSGNAAFRTFAFFFTTYIGRFIVGFALIGGGLFYGLGSHTVTYQKDFTGRYSGYLDFHDESYYVRPGGQDSQYLIIQIANFTPLPVDLTEEDSPEVVSLIYRSEIQKLDKHYGKDVEIVGDGYQVIAFTLIDQNGNTQEYTTAEYREHPSGFYENHWLIGSILIGVGLLFLLLSLVVFWLDKRTMARSLASSDPPGI